MIETRPDKFGTLHFIGIGGIGMSGIAEALHTLGYSVQGSDQNESYNTKRLERQGIHVHLSHHADHLKTPDGSFVSAVVVSSAIKPGNPELLEARRMRLPIVRRADMLAELMRLKTSIAVAGTHGKTTTTSLIGALLEEGGLDPTIINGGIIHAYGTNTRMGQGDWMVVESDESDGSFNRLPTTVAVVTNIDPEHMEHYGSFDAVRTAYRNFVENIPFYGFAVLCLDHPEVRALAQSVTDRRVLTYGFSDGADVQGRNLKATPEGLHFDVAFSSRVTGAEAETVTGFTLPMMGEHNAQNALAALTIGQALDLKADDMCMALARFQGVNRRFTRVGESHGITIIDDYGHHPVEIRAVLSAGRQALSSGSGRLIAVMQPHRYSRLSSLFPEFCAAFDQADTVIVADVYAAGEDPIEGVNKETLADGIERQKQAQVHALSGPDALAPLIADLARPGDLVICLGAGSISGWAHALPAQLDTILATLPEGRAHG